MAQKSQKKVEKKESATLGSFMDPESDKAQTEQVPKSQEEITTKVSEDQADQVKETKSEKESVPKKTVSTNQPDIGDRCPVKKCPGYLSEYSRHRGDEFLTIFLSCSKCNAKPKAGKRVTPNS